MTLRLPHRFGAIGAFALAALLPTPALAHCDGLDGPVVASARLALESGDPTRALAWVQPGHDAAIRAAFAQTLTVRRLSPEARALADRYFFETLVRLHRAGEGAPYTGLQPAGRDLGPAIPLADRAVESGVQTELAARLAESVTEGVRSRFEELQRKRRLRDRDLDSGRDYVASYVDYIHYVERVHQVAAATVADPAESHDAH